MANIQALTGALWALTRCCIAAIALMFVLGIMFCVVQALVEFIVEAFR